MRQLFHYLGTPLLILGLLAGFSAPLLAFPASAAAVDIFNNCTNNSATAEQKSGCNDCASSVASQSDYCKEFAQQTSNPIIHIITIIISVVSYLSGAAAIIALIVSGLKFILANGDSNAITSARNGVVYALIGLAVLILSQGIVVFVLDKVK